MRPTGSLLLRVDGLRHVARCGQPVPPGPGPFGACGAVRGHLFERARLEPGRGPGLLRRQPDSPRRPVRPGTRRRPGRPAAVRDRPGVRWAARRADSGQRGRGVGCLVRWVRGAPLSAGRHSGRGRRPASEPGHRLHVRRRRPWRTLFITTSRQGIAAGTQPDAGSVYVTRPGVTGLPVTPFAG